ncbi:BREX-2 system adenine-specific DNA-methyltransferase PglX [Mycobacterium sp. ITM-2016-00316]|uniref:BREX-2 system adenine-specific DNA-methyltransferase PglX n=1 Tax=Mycobacterium sp. ITM-2016-00316 TaxID=2099695 RepID=UPI000CF9A0A2|nr:BREX-2 system adenine-specific DNA-methyltransferase PglX [Mycobacterium sp. ITM-2016-00316]WNG83726.1 BREX-2 system adenine-specific DNA-methyltransferase PglX [Mycobacterium sp. ITM-2016-00316]
MINSSALLADLKGQLRVLQADLKQGAEDSSSAWGTRLKEEHAEALRRERTGLSWVDWRDNEVDQAAVAWIIATTFLRFCEDNDLLAGAKIDGLPTAVGWIAGPGDRVQRAEENLTAYFRDNPTHNRRHWLQQGFAVLAAQPAGAALVDPKHNPVWKAEINPEVATALITFWRRTNDDGILIHDFTDPNLQTRFLGDLYQDLSEHAKKTYALLQTPVFVEEFILDQTLTPAVAEFGLDGLKLIDPACGSGHFLLGAFERLNQAWLEAAPGLDAKERVRRAMASIYGVDINPFAVAIARFRLTVAGLNAAGEHSLVGVPVLGFHLAIGDSLLGEWGGVPAALDLFEEDDEKQTYLYDTEDLTDYLGILQPGQYHVVVGNPPYINVADPLLSDLYRSVYDTAYREYALSAPFSELLFRLAIRGHQGQGAGYVGQITSNSFMKREFGKKLIEEFFGGSNPTNPVDLTRVVDTSGAHIPGHGTPTVILIGRRRRPVSPTVPVVLRVRGEPGLPRDAAKGLAWTEIAENFNKPGYEGRYVSVMAFDRERLGTSPWTLSGGVPFEHLESTSTRRLVSVAATFGYTGQTNADSAFIASAGDFARAQVEERLLRDYVVGEDVRNFGIGVGSAAIFPYLDGALVAIDKHPSLYRWLWRLRASTWARRTFSKRTYKAERRTWWEWHQVALNRVGGLSITSAFVATHNHFALDRKGRIFNRSAPTIWLAEGAPLDQHLELLGLLNSSTACFWLKQVCHNKGNGGIGGGIGDEDWEPRYEFTGTKLAQFPLPTILPRARGRVLDSLANELGATAPSQVVADWGESCNRELAQLLTDAEATSSRLQRRLIFEQEELDWEVYRMYGLVDSDLTYSGQSIEEIALGQRAFEIALARRVAVGEEETAWFDRHRSVPTTEIPSEWPEDYADLVQRRLNLIETDRHMELLERPEFKRRWALALWGDQLTSALRDAILARLELPALWQDAGGPINRSAAELADELRKDALVKELAAALTGSREPELTALIERLASDEAVPFLAAHRYKPSGVEKFRSWQAVWELQRREDAGEKVDVHVPPKYAQADFRKTTYWKARGKLDVPKERFISYPGVAREGDSTPVLGWAGWSHRDQALALAREIPGQQALGADDEALVPLVAGLVELEPWLAQWHSEIEPQFGASPASVISGVVDQYLARMEKTRDQVTAWTPPVATRGRRPSR